MLGQPVVDRLARRDLAATNLDVSLTSWYEAETTGEGGVAVQAWNLMEIVRALAACTPELDKARG